MINDHTKQGDEEDWGGTNLTAYKGVYDNWDTEKKGSKCILPFPKKIFTQTNPPDAKCTFGSGQNQMTMTYISFTGWLRSLQCDFHLVLWQHSLETGIHFDSHANQVFWWVQCKFIFCNCKHGGSAKDSSGRLLLNETSFEG